MRLGGMAKVTIDGVTIRCDDSSVKIKKGKPKREEILSAGGASDFSETPQAAEIEFEALDDPSVDWDSIEDATSSTIQIDKPNGKIIVGLDMWFAGDYEQNLKDGKRSMLFKGRKISES